MHWLVLVYRVPSEPASKRVAIWRELKRLGGLYLQQCVCILPRQGHVATDLERIAARIPVMDGEYTLFDVPKLRPADEARTIEAFRALRNKEYAEIIEECETKFIKEVEFEHFRQNYTFEEAEEIRQDLEKVRRWFDQVQERDWFKADGRSGVEAWLERCQDALAGFEEEVYRRTSSDEDMDTSKGAAPASSTATEPLQLAAAKTARRSRQARGATEA